MKNFAKLLLAMTLLLALVALSACGTTPAVTTGTASESDATTAPVVEEKTYSIGIIQLIQHDALDAATEGFMAALTERLGDKVTFDLQNAQGEQNNCTTIVTKFVNDKVDLIMANATNAVVAAKEATDTIPVVGTSVTDYVSTGLVASNEVPGGNVTGASDMNPVSNQLALIKAFAPDAKNIGIIICSAEENSKIQADEATKIFEAEGYTVKTYFANDSSDLQAVATKAVGESDIIYEPTDNLVAANMGVVRDIAAPAGIVVICGEESMCLSGGVASYSINYYDLGYKAGLQAYEILVKGASPADMPISIFSTDELNLVVNEEVMAEMNITLPEALQK